MSFVKCSVDGCNKKLQPLFKLDPRDRETWTYRECDVCFRPACDKHAQEIEGRLVCDRCRREAAARQAQPEILQLGFRSPGPADPESR